MRSVSVLGATGSVGESAFDLLMRAGGPAAYRTVALTGGANVARLAEMARALQAEIAATAWPDKLADLRAALPAGTRFVTREERTAQRTERARQYQRRLEPGRATTGIP